ncbi:hypothetical protein NQ318_013078 [Aromia moschata]|uniref:receptor protein serine/threonine kinase n=1 Tax=Aromia moschata TaxID=1265417 RepID=A0AAV8Y1H0_9CUCU|nr:hypothetical protein NQ318_013078 [Aromia moschata]
MAASKLFNCLLIVVLLVHNGAGEVVRSTQLQENTDDEEEINSAHDPGEPPPNDLLRHANPNSIRSATHLNRYKCHSCEPPDCSRLTTCTNAIQCWKSKVRESSGEESVTRGCTTDSEQLPLICRTPSLTVQHKRHTSGQFQIDCCVGDFCNSGSFPELPPFICGKCSLIYGLKLLAAVLIPLMVLGALGIIVLYLLRRYHRNRLCNESRLDPDMYCASDELLRATAAGDSTLREYLEHSMTSGSGSGLPLLIQRTLAKQISLVECIGKGRYGEVWRGIWHGDSVAVKIFFSRDEASWTRETEIYSTVLLRHENILGYIGSDMTSRNSCTQLWLITHYHSLGSLYDYLNYTSLSHQQLMRLCLSIANGLVHLHTEIFGTQGYKEQKYFGENNGTCCIADFGLAVTHYQSTDKVDIGANPRVGTKRIRMDNFDSFRRADVYALGLVLWEICRRTISNGIAEDYKPPFFDVVPSDPSFEDMKKVVCLDQQRPTSVWHGEADEGNVGTRTPNVRLPALRIKKTLLKLASADKRHKHRGHGDMRVTREREVERLSDSIK